VDFRLGQDSSLAHLLNLGGDAPFVGIGLLPDAFVLPLPYGDHVDWFRSSIELSREPGQGRGATAILPLDMD
jgi:hypothetical protein